MNHWVILPILLPAVVGSVLVLAVRHDIVLSRIFSIASMAMLVALSISQLSKTMDGAVGTYALGNWAPPFGIVLVVDQLSAVMLLLTSILGFTVGIYSLGGWDRRGEHFHPLLQFQMMGLNGAFLTGDLFNLFVFFEVLLIASYGLVVQGGGPARMRAGIQYVVTNLIGSTIFLMALALIYSVAGTLNLADLYNKARTLPDGDQALFDVGVFLLWVVFCLKSAMFPLHLWMPGTYANAPGPVAALFSIMTKVGIYSSIRIYDLSDSLLGDNQFSTILLGGFLVGSLGSMLVGAIGVFSAKHLGQQASFAALLSMGVIMLTLFLPSEPMRAAGLYYIVHSTLSMAAFFFVVDLVTHQRPVEGDALRVSPKYPAQSVHGFIFLAVVVSLSGLPPFSGFIGKLLMLQASFHYHNFGWLWLAILASSLLAILGFARSGSLLFWKSGSLDDSNENEQQNESRVSKQDFRSIDQIGPYSAVGLLMIGILFLTLFAQPMIRFAQSATSQYFDSESYSRNVLSIRGR